MPKKPRAGIYQAFRCAMCGRTGKIVNPGEEQSSTESICPQCGGTGWAEPPEAGPSKPPSTRGNEEREGS